MAGLCKFFTRLADSARPVGITLCKRIIPWLPVADVAGGPRQLLNNFRVIVRTERNRKVVLCISGAQQIIPWLPVADVAGGPRQLLNNYGGLYSAHGATMKGCALYQWLMYVPGGQVKGISTLMLVKDQKEGAQCMPGGQVWQSLVGKCEQCMPGGQA
jgi:hypothetical protein